MIKEALLDQYEEGKYRGDFVITQIKPSTYTTSGRLVVEIRAWLESMSLVAREVRARYPDMKILLTTGYTENAIERTNADGKQFEVISKPYLPNVLAAKIRQVLDGPNGVS